MPSSDYLLGLHHVSALTSDAARNLEFYTEVLGLRLVLKTVNQDDLSSYHLFYGDAAGTPGTDLTFFDVPHRGSIQPGSGLISGTSLRVRGADVLSEWATRLDEHDVRRTPVHERAGRRALTLFDDEGQCLHLVNDANETDLVPNTTPWTDGPVPESMSVRGLGPVEITVADLEPTERVLTDVMGFEAVGPYEVSESDTSFDESDHPIPSPAGGARAKIFQTGPGGVASEVHVVERPDDPRGRLGPGGVHHFALRTPDGDAIRAWNERISDAGLNPSPVIDRHYFESMYVREPGGILIEIATDTGAPFPVEEATAGTLSLPPSLEQRRSRIESALPPIGPGRTEDTVT